ncbi:MAG TPA: cbb3-type cytochrome oxidase assembly protein CcoS [Tepidisphaeraceae bacterium]|jgi:cbb3-type cytochrome oxidase maturation protein
MQVLFIVLPLAILMAGVALAAFIGAVSRGQFDDLDTPQIRAILDDPTDSKPLPKADVR